MTRCAWIVWYGTLHVVVVEVGDSFTLIVYALEDEEGKASFKRKLLIEETYMPDSIIVNSDVTAARIDLRCAYCTAAEKKITRIVADRALSAVQQLLRDGLLIAGGCTGGGSRGG